MGLWGGVTLIVLSGPGARARQVTLSSAWLLSVVLFGTLPLGASLWAGRTARAWFDPSSGPSLLAPTRALAAAPPDALSAASMAPPPPPPPDPHLSPLSGPSAPDRAPSEAVPPAAMPRDPAALVAAEKPSPVLRPQDLAALEGAELKLFDINAGQALSIVPFATAGAAAPEAFAALRSFMRCRRSGREHEVDPRLVAVLLRISHHFDDAVLQVISAHRTADGVVTRSTSQHTLGTAVDIRIPGVSIERLALAARELGANGIGLYPLSRFVHVDVRAQPYSWRDEGEGPVATRVEP